MKIAFVSDAITPYHFGGKEKRLESLAKILADQGHQVTVYTAKYWDSPPELSYTLKAIAPARSLYTPQGKRSILQAVQFAWGCRKLLYEDFDIVDVDHMPFFPVIVMKCVCFLKSKPMVVTWHEVWGTKYWIEYLGIKGLIGSFFEIISAHLADGILAVSPQTSQHLQQMQYKKSTIKAIVNSVDTQLLQTPTKNIRKQDFLFVGRLLEHKHVDMAIRAIATLAAQGKARTLTIVGQGVMLPALQSLANELKVKKMITFVTNANDKKLAKIYASSRVFVLPSTREGFGIVVIEAWAAGLPVVTINHPQNNARDLISDSAYGQVCELSAQSLADAMEAQLQKPSAHATKKRQKKAKEYDLESWGKQVSHYYQQIIDQKTTV